MVEFLTKAWVNSSTLETEEMATVPSGLKTRGKDEEKKLLEIFLAACQREDSLGEFLKFLSDIQILWEVL